MSNPIRFNQDFNTKQQFNRMKTNSKLLQEKDELYDYLNKDKKKNLKKLSKLLADDEKQIDFINTPLHKILLKTINTVENFSNRVIKRDFSFSMNYEEKIYIGIACLMLSMLLILFSF
tara:strand:- start:20305 stop:20658 length:354 start_codon:yes stop_codon:yes gene_type:complete